MIHERSRSRTGLLCGLCVAFLCVVALAGTAVRGVANEGMALMLCAEPVETGEGRAVFAVSLSRAAVEVSAGDAVAVRLTAEVPRGWSVVGVTAAEGAVGLTVTVGVPRQDGGSDGRAVAVLLDGYPTTEEGHMAGRLVYITMERTAGDARAALRLTFGGGAEGWLYVRRTTGDIETVRLYAAGTEWTQVVTESDTLGTDTVDGTGCERESTTETATAATETEASSKIDVMTGTVVEAGGTEGGAGAFLGCRETAVRAGTFAVQLLFEVGAVDAAVVCVEGGGVLSLECHTVASVADGMGEREPPLWRAYTYRGLLAEGQYRFWVYTDRAVVEIRYHNGRFVEMKTANHD